MAGQLRRRDVTPPQARGAPLNRRGRGGRGVHLVIVRDTNPNGITRRAAVCALAAAATVGAIGVQPGFKVNSEPAGARTNAARVAGCG